jgi:hypothetical protein
MFMRYRGGGVGHKSIREATRSLLDDRDPLDKIPFTKEKEHEAQGSEDEMMEDDGEEEGDEEGDETEGSEDELEETSEEDEQEGGDDTRTPLTTEQLIDDEVADEMDEFGYTGLDQILVEDEDEELLPDEEEALGAEDGEEGVINEGEEVGFADL